MTRSRTPRLRRLAGSADGVIVPAYEDLASALEALVAERSPATATRLIEATATTVDAVEPLPDAVAEAFGPRDRVRPAAEAVAALEVLLPTEVASQLGVTITITVSDSDGDA